MPWMSSLDFQKIAPCHCIHIVKLAQKITTGAGLAGSLALPMYFCKDILFVSIGSGKMYFPPPKHKLFFKRKFGIQKSAFLVACWAEPFGRRTEKIGSESVYRRGQRRENLEEWKTSLQQRNCLACSRQRFGATEKVHWNSLVPRYRDVSGKYYKHWIWS